MQEVGFLSLDVGGEALGFGVIDGELDLLPLADGLLLCLLLLGLVLSALVPAQLSAELGLVAAVVVEVDGVGCRGKLSANTALHVTNARFGHPHRFILAEFRRGLAHRSGVRNSPNKPVTAAATDAVTIVCWDIFRILWVGGREGSDAAIGAEAEDFWKKGVRVRTLRSGISDAFEGRGGLTRLSFVDGVNIEGEKLYRELMELFSTNFF